MKTTQARRDELRKLEQAATKGPWNFANSNSMRRIGSEGRDGNVVSGCRTSDGANDVQMRDEDGVLIPAARNSLADLLDDLRDLAAMEKERDELVDALRRCNCQPCDIPACNCGSWHRRPSKADIEIDELRAENERLRGLLERALGYTRCTPPCAGYDDALACKCGSVQLDDEISEAALGNTQEARDV